MEVMRLPFNALSHCFYSPAANSALPAFVVNQRQPSFVRQRSTALTHTAFQRPRLTAYSRQPKGSAARLWLIQMLTAAVAGHAIHRQLRSGSANPVAGHVPAWLFYWRVSQSPVVFGLVWCLEMVSGF